MIRGTVFDIKRFALHDGTGLRSTIFLKGCPLSCPWCQNPEGISPAIGLRWTSSRCIGCGLCVAACPEGALILDPADKTVAIDTERCRVCGVCCSECPTNALSRDGRLLSPDEAAVDLLRDLDFFDESGGGVTFSGGEPLLQAEFVAATAALCRGRGVDVAIETTLAVANTALREVIPVTNTFLVDLKLADEEEHRRILGVDAGTVRWNLTTLLDAGADVVIRIPLIPGYTAEKANLAALGSYIAGLGERQPLVELLNYNPLAENKYRVLGIPWRLPAGVRPFTNLEMKAAVAILSESGVKETCYQ